MPSAALLARAGAGASVETQEAANDALGDGPDEETTRVSYRVRSGDTLFAIAKRYGTTVESLKV